ncbi:HopJ type III effector protein [Marinobacter salicampi]|uniref:HopJ type III effector protein n=1 Tax=Marinobacter salicampi TaxID=435907 RepID=UPI00140B5544|nr:HopJ type III effector protein [Marinobacter salicampi]
MILSRAMQIHLAALGAGRADFEDTLALVERFFNYTPTAFRNSLLHNGAGENEGSCKLFALAQHCNLNETDTLACFGRHYRHVLENPTGGDHANIRQFMGTGWSGIAFDAMPLRARPADETQTPEDKTAS